MKMKSDRFRASAKVIFGLGLLLGSIACGVYGVMLIPWVKGVPFEWEYLALIGFAVALVGLISLILLGIAKCEEMEEAERDEKVEELAALMDEAIPVCQTEVESIDCTIGEEKPKKKLNLKLDKKTVKTVAMIAIPVIVAGALAASVSSNIKNAKKAKKRKQFYQWLG